MVDLGKFDNNNNDNNENQKTGHNNYLIWLFIYMGVGLAISIPYIIWRLTGCPIFA